MTEVKLIETTQPGKLPLLSGTTFGFVGRPIVFRVNSEKADNPLTIAFIVKKDETKRDFNIELSPIVNDILTITYYNPPDIGTSGLGTPAQIARITSDTGTEDLGFMFNIEPNFTTNVYRMFYEFYDGIPSAVQAGGAQ